MNLKNQWETQAELKTLARQILKKNYPHQKEVILDQYARDCVF